MFKDESNCMTTYGPDPDVPTAGVLPVDDCVIAPPVTATSTVFRTPNCPTIRWEASRCREPSARAFAVKGASRMDSRMVCGVGGTGFRGGSGNSAGVESEFIGRPLRAHRGGILIAHRHPHDGTGASPNDRGVACVEPASDVLKGVALPRSQRPRICSERGITHGFSGDRRRSRDGSPLPRLLPCCPHWTEPSLEDRQQCSRTLRLPGSY